eukprot:scaffold48985_cov41-Phaeocystis_antarctica.AAC.1
MIRADGQLPAHFTVTLTVARSSSAAIMAMIAETSRLWLIVGGALPTADTRSANSRGHMRSRPPSSADSSSGVVGRHVLPILT